MHVFPTGSLAAGAQLVRAIGELAGVDDHRVGVDVRPHGVTVSLITVTDSYFGMSRRDVELARGVGRSRTRLCRRPLRGPELAGHPRRHEHRGGHAVLAGRPRL